MRSWGTEVAVEIRNNPVKAQVVPLPFYKKPKKVAQQREISDSPYRMKGREL